MGLVNTATDVEDFLRGANFLSASGGGDPAVEREDLLSDVEDGLDIGWVPLDQFDDDDVLFCACYSGSIARSEGGTVPKYSAIQRAGATRLN